jgi:RimJ/RimL family protein N-acetyltransferase
MTHCPPLHLDTLPVTLGGTVLRRLRPGDLSVFHAYRSDAELARYQGWSVMSVQEAAAFIDDVAGTQALVPGGWVQLAIADAVTDGLLGDVGLYVDDQQTEAEIGFTLSRAAQGAGHATRAVRAAAALLFQASGVARVRAVTDARNAPSIRVLERAGFRRVREQHAVFKGEACVEWVYLLP